MAQAMLGLNSLEHVTQRQPDSLAQLLAAYARQHDLYAVDASRDPRFTASAAQSLLDQAPADLSLLPRYPDGRGEFDAAMHAQWQAGNRPLLDDRRCGPVQLAWKAPWSTRAENNLKQTLESLWDDMPSKGRIAVEFQDASWFRGDALRMLEEHQVGLVWSTRAGLVPYKVTADFITVRLTGQTSRRCPDEVAAFLGRLRDRLDRRDVYVISASPGQYGIKALERFARGIGHPLRTSMRDRQVVLESFA